jgi:hypothetical protein
VRLISGGTRYRKSTKKRILIHIYGSLESNEFWEQGVGGWIEALRKLVLYIAF